MLGTDGNFYGTTTEGGIIADPCGGDCGTVFRISPAGKLTTLHRFDSTDGSTPYGRLVQATNGDFYGTTQSGGASGNGTVFSITSGGTLTTLPSFDGTDGAGPIAALIQATNGNFYGTTAGACDISNPAHISGNEALGRGIIYDSVFNDTGTAICWYHVGADQGNEQAELNYGWVLLNGLGGFAKDPAQAFAWLQKSTMHGNDIAARAYRKRL